VKFSCEKCGRSYVADEKVRGRAFKMKCKQCGNLIVVKAASPSPTPLPGSIPPVSPPARPTTPPALELERAPDPFASAADPFAPPAGDPFAVPSPDPFTPATSPARASFDPFAEAPPEPGHRANGASALPEAPPPVDEADAAFADLSREMASDEEAPIERGFAPIAPEPVIAAPLPPPPPVRRVEIPAPVPPPPVAAPARRPVVPAAPAPARPLAKKSPAPLIGAGLALVVAVGIAGWLFSRSDKPETKPSPSPPVAVRASEGATQRAPSPPQVAATAAPPVQAAPPAPERNAEKAPPPAGAEEPRDDARVAKHRPAEKAAPPPRKKEVARAPELVKPPPQKAVPLPSPEPPRQDAPKVAIAPKSAPVTSTAPANTGFGRTNPAAPPVSTNADLPPLDEGRVEATFAKYAKNLDACVTVAREGGQASELNGRTVNVTMTVNPNGKVLYPTLDDVELNGTDLGKCLKKESGRIQFPAFGGEPIRVRKPIVLK